MREIEERYNELRSDRIPQGLKTLAGDLYIDLDLYKAYIAGFASSYLQGVKIDPNSIHINEAIDRKLEACLEKLNEYMAYKKKIDTLGMLLKEQIAAEQKE